ncbi:hypothetical protein cyc_00848 [Cyclospora cayetanensis]|uniref:U4/U6.U5 small nuclear ribonucleoprotein 27kDa protein domain-containing protein n=1 Tax=Cyclospora cayetanensis TaxID=88456 RepID=A0A1D3CX76_9EIME|nr:hypothetical protein cyc_00848 [Cyclospora cayetanensis]
MHLFEPVAPSGPFMEAKGALKGRKLAATVRPSLLFSLWILMSSLLAKIPDRDTYESHHRGSRRWEDSRGHSSRRRSRSASRERREWQAKLAARRRERGSSEESEGKGALDGASAVDPNLTEEQLMEKLMGFGDFSSSKGKEHTSTDVSGVAIHRGKTADARGNEECAVKEGGGVCAFGLVRMAEGGGSFRKLHDPFAALSLHIRVSAGC